MLSAIKVGDTRVVANQIQWVRSYTSDNLAKSADGKRVNVFSKDADDKEKISELVTEVHIADDNLLIFFADEARDFLRQFDALTGIAETDAVAEAVAATEMIWTADYIAAFTSDSISELTDKHLVQLEENLVMLKNSKISLVNPKQVDDLAWQVTREIVIRGLDKVTAKPETTSKVAAPETGTQPLTVSEVIGVVELADLVAPAFEYIDGLVLEDIYETMSISTHNPEKTKVSAAAVKLAAASELKRRSTR